MKKRFWLGVLLNLVALIGACLVNLLVCSVAIKIVNLFIVVNFFEAAIIRTVMSFVTLCGVIGALTYFEGFKNAEFLPLSTAAELVTAGVGQLVLSVPLMFYPFIAGGTRYLAGLLDMGASFDGSEKIKEIYLWTYLASFVIYLAAELCAAIALGIVGKKMRLKQRREIFAGQNGQQSEKM